MHPVIELKNLSKTFLTRETAPGILGSLKGLFSAKTQEIAAIQSLTFSIGKGERIAFIGPNGAGKSTTIKMLTGILHPSGGDVEVLGLVPWKDRHALGYQIGTVFGQRTQLWYHLPPSDTFHLLSKIYEIPKKEYQTHLAELVALLKSGT